jgi:hypothetical protein
LQQRIVIQKAGCSLDHREERLNEVRTTAFRRT